MKRTSAFTLIETLISAAIVVVVLGGSVAANRLILSGTARQQDYTQMNSLADQAISMVSAYVDSGKTLGMSPLTIFNLTPSLSQDISTYGTFVQRNVFPDVSCNNTNCPGYREIGPSVVTWCPSDTAGRQKAQKPSCGSTISAIKITGIALTPAANKCPAVNGNCNLIKLFATVMPNNFMPSDLVAVHNKLFDQYGDTFPGSGKQNKCVNQLYLNSYEQVIDVSGTVHTGSCMDVAADAPEWGMYMRQIKITLPGGPDPCPSPNGLSFHADANGADLSPSSPGANCLALRNSSLIVTVRIGNYNNPQLTVTKSIILAAW